MGEPGRSVMPGACVLLLYCITSHAGVECCPALYSSTPDRAGRIIIAGWPTLSLKDSGCILPCARSRGREGGRRGIALLTACPQHFCRVPDMAAYLLDHCARAALTWRGYAGRWISASWGTCSSRETRQDTVRQITLNLGLSYGLGRISESRARIHSHHCLAAKSAQRRIARLGYRRIPTQLGPITISRSRDGIIFIARPQRELT
jgi:hypothetical protein